MSDKFKISDIDKIDEKQQKTLDTAQSRMRRFVSRTVKNFASAVGALASKRKSKSVTESVAIANRLNEELKNAGLDDLREAFNLEFDPIMRSALEYFEPLGFRATLTGVDRTTINAFRQLANNELTLIARQQLVTPVQRTLLATHLGSLDREVVIDELISSQLGTAEYQIRNFVDWSHEGYQRQITVAKAEELSLEWYIWRGPRDRITSHQCEAIFEKAPHGVPGVFHKDEINVASFTRFGISQRNGKPLRYEPLIWGGHPQCRHKFFPLPLEVIKERYGNRFQDKSRSR